MKSKLKSSINYSENHVVVGELLETKSQQVDINTPKSVSADANWNPDSETSHITGGYGVGFSLTVLQVCISCWSCEHLMDLLEGDGHKEITHLQIVGTLWEL